MRNAGLEEIQAGIKIVGEISITSDRQMTPEVLEEVLKEGRIAVNLEKGVLMLFVCRHGGILAVLVDFARTSAGVLSLKLKKVKA